MMEIYKLHDMAPLQNEAIDNAVALLQRYGIDTSVLDLDVPEPLTSFVGSDEAFKNFFAKFFSIPAGASSFTVNYLDLETLDFAAGQIAAERDDRDMRHTLIRSLFGTRSSTELYRNLAGFRKAFVYLVRGENYWVTFK